MKAKIVKIITLTIIMCFSASAAASVGIDGVDVIPGQPLITDIITFDISGSAANSSSWVEYDLFTQNGTSLQLDLYVDMGILTMVSDWTYSKDISPLSAGTYTLEVRGFDYHFGTLKDTYTVGFTVVPEPTTVLFLVMGTIAVRAKHRNRLRQHKHE